MSSDGTRVAIGASTNDGSGSDAGHVRVYAESGGTWTQIGSDIDGKATGDQFGVRVSMSADGTRVAIGAPFNDDGGNNAGHVRVYAENGVTWTQVGGDINGEAAGDQFGRSVSVSTDGTRVAIGAPSTTAPGPTLGTCACTWRTGALGPKLAGTSTARLRATSRSVSIDVHGRHAWRSVLPTTMAPAKQMPATCACMREQRGLDSDRRTSTANADDSTGISVSMSTDGTRGDRRSYDGGAGHVRVLREWRDMDHGSGHNRVEAGDQAEISVSMSSDGRVAIGSYGNDGNGNSAGHVRVFQFGVPCTPCIAACR